MEHNGDTGESREDEVRDARPMAPRDQPRKRRRRETVAVSSDLYSQVQQLEHLLIGAADLRALLEILLQGVPKHFSLPASELWLFDPGQVVARLLDDSGRNSPMLRFLHDVFELAQLYGPEPEVTLIDATDSRMFEVLKAEDGIGYALLMPLRNDGELIGSLHWGLRDDELVRREADADMIAHLGSIISLCFQSAVNRQRLSRLNLIDPLTEIANRRGFEIDIAREIDRARRERRPLSLALLEIDEYADLHQYHGSTTSEYVVRKVAERIASTLRSTDRLGRLTDARLAVLLPGSGAVLAEEVAQRMRADVEDFQIDDGRGAVMHTTLSAGLATWEPQRYPARDMPQLARQLESAAGNGLRNALTRGGNTVGIARLGALIV
jgi:diguanylate cyclase (GGDEF)-like protein